MNGRSGGWLGRLQQLPGQTKRRIVWIGVILGSLLIISAWLILNQWLPEPAAPTPNNQATGFQEFQEQLGQTIEESKKNFGEISSQIQEVTAPLLGTDQPEATTTTEDLSPNQLELLKQKIIEYNQASSTATTTP